MTGWLIVIAVGVGTYAARVSFIAGLGERRFPEPLERALSYVAPAIFAAIVFPAVLLPQGSLEVTLGANPRFAAAVAAALAAWLTRSVAAVVLVGMGALWALQAVF